jgi:ketosteroid isomerase-like protein
MNTTQTIVEKFLQFLGSRELENLVQLFADNVDWNIPGDTSAATWLGERSSKTEVTDFFRTLWLATESLSAEIHKIFIQQSDVVITGSFVTRMLQTKKVVESIFFIHFTVQDNLIVKYTLLEDSYAVSRSLVK